MLCLVEGLKRGSGGGSGETDQWFWKRGERDGDMKGALFGERRSEVKVSKSIEVEVKKALYSEAAEEESLLLAYSMTMKESRQMNRRGSLT